MGAHHSGGLLAALAGLPAAGLRPAPGAVAGQGHGGAGLFRPHPERPQRGLRDHGHPHRRAALRLHRAGRAARRRIQDGRPNVAAGGAGEAAGAAPEAGGEAKKHRGVTQKPKEVVTFLFPARWDQSDCQIFSIPSFFHQCQSWVEVICQFTCCFVFFIL